MTRLEPSDRQLILDSAPKDGEQVSITHCKSGHANRRLYIKTDGDRVLYNCFHCGLRGSLRLADSYKDAATIRERMRRPGGGVYPGEAGESIALPSDCTTTLREWDHKAAIWVMGFGIVSNEIRERMINYSKAKQSIVLPMFSDDRIVGYQSRKFPESVPKYVTHKLKDIRHYDVIRCHGNSYGTLAICEDYISAVKLARFVDVLCCYGTSVAIKPSTLACYNNVVLWLDHDNRQVIRKELDAFYYIRQFCDACRIVKTGDAKRQSNDVIKAELGII